MARPVRKKRSPKKYGYESGSEREASPGLKENKTSVKIRQIKKREKRETDSSESPSSSRLIPTRSTHLKSHDFGTCATNHTKSTESMENTCGELKMKPDNSEMTENKFFKTKKLGRGGGALLTGNVLKNAKAKKNSGKKTERKESLGFVPPLRQTTLSESFGKGLSLQSRLRPRKAAKQYQDASVLEKSISPEKRNSIILLERIDGAKANKMPVYKGIKLVDSVDTKDKESIYDFQFDADDPEEKSGKKKKKKTVRKAAPKRKRKIVTAKIVQRNDEALEALPPEAEKMAEKPSGEVLPVLLDKKKQFADNEEKPKLAAIEKTTEITPQTVAEKELSPISAESLPPRENFEGKSPRPRICRVETLTGDRKVSFRPNLSISRQSSAKFNPFRSTQSIFKPRSTLNTRDMLDHSLLNKSLSPIKNVDSFDPASPWRPPISNSFYRVKQVVQSTPQVKRRFERSTQGFRIDENDENDENNQNTASKGAGGISPTIKQPVKKALVPLGVRISNAENIQASNTRKSSTLLPLETAASVSKFENSINSSNYWEYKGNSGFGDRLYRSPNKKSDKIAAPAHGSPVFKKRNNLCAIDEVPSPASLKKYSGINECDENSPPADEPKMMKQSNLNNFLNIDEMPESITINTSHGIFGDAHSTPIIKSNLTPKVQPQANLENCFGFDDDSRSEVQVSPVKTATPVKKLFRRLKDKVFTANKEAPLLSAKNTARISLGEIKNTLYPRKEKKCNNTEMVAKRIENLKLDSKLKEPVNAVQFSDTFDILSESGQGDGDEKSLDTEIALFVDLEPVHFTKPPRWSYAKKRDHKQYWSTDEDEDEDCVAGRAAPVLKKRKVAKINKAEEKKIDEWVKSVNETFQEIDDFDLVVEKRA